MKKVTLYKLENRSQITAQDITGDTATFYAVNFFDWFCETQRTGLTIWLHDLFTGIVVKSSIGGTACMTYSYSDFFLSMHKEINDLFSEFIACSENVIWTRRDMAA